MLNHVLVSYTRLSEEGSTTNSYVSVTVDSIEATSVGVPRLVAGIRYTFNITAENSIGSSHLMCGPYLLRVGNKLEFQHHAHTKVCINIFIYIFLITRRSY